MSGEVVLCSCPPAPYGLAEACGASPRPCPSPMKLQEGLRVLPGRFAKELERAKQPQGCRVPHSQAGKEAWSRPGLRHLWGQES